MLSYAYWQREFGGEILGMGEPQEVQLHQLLARVAQVVLKEAGQVGDDSEDAERDAGGRLLFAGPAQRQRVLGAEAQVLHRLHHLLPKAVALLRPLMAASDVADMAKEARWDLSPAARGSVQAGKKLSKCK